MKITAGPCIYAENTTILLSFVDNQEYYDFSIETNCRTDCSSQVGLLLTMEAGIIQTCSSLYDESTYVPTSVFVEQTNVRAQFPFHTRPMTIRELYAREDMPSLNDDSDA